MQKSMIEYKYNKNLVVEMYNYNKIIDQLEAMSPANQDEFAQKLLERNGGLAVNLSTKINIAHQDKYYTDSEAMNESLDTRGHA